MAMGRNVVLGLVGSEGYVGRAWSTVVITATNGGVKCSSEIASWEKFLARDVRGGRVCDTSNRRIIEFL